MTPVPLGLLVEPQTPAASGPFWSVVPTTPAPDPVPATAEFVPTIASPLAFVFVTSMVRDEFPDVAEKGKLGAVVPTPTPLPLSYSSESPALFEDVNFSKRLVVPFMFA